MSVHTPWIYGFLQPWMSYLVWSDPEALKTAGLQHWDDPAKAWRVHTVGGTGNNILVGGWGTGQSAVTYVGI
jgi:hypothetical protein